MVENTSSEVGDGGHKYLQQPPQVPHFRVLCRASAPTRVVVMEQTTLSAHMYSYILYSYMYNPRQMSHGVLCRSPGTRSIALPPSRQCSVWWIAHCPTGQVASWVWWGMCSVLGRTLLMEQKSCWKVLGYQQRQKRISKSKKKHQQKRIIISKLGSALLKSAVASHYN